MPREFAAFQSGLEIDRSCDEQNDCRCGVDFVGAIEANLIKPMR